MPRRCDLWRIGIVPRPIADIIALANLDHLGTHWLAPGPPFTFLADPFGLWRHGILHLFAEAYDYRTRHGVIECLRFDAGFDPIDRQTVLRTDWHLSYPFVFEDAGQTWMLPEAHRSGQLTLYRADRFPDRWVPAATIDVQGGAVDATPFRHQGRWWLFYARATSRRSRREELCAAYSDRLQGPWVEHRGNPIRIDPAGGRPGGTPCVIDGVVVLPLQDCSRTYGGAIRPLRFVRLGADSIETELGAPITSPDEIAPFTEGLHTLAGCGDVTLVDVKRVDRSGRGLLVDVVRAARRVTG